jgi:hypothetical protein
MTAATAPNGGVNMRGIERLPSGRFRVRFIRKGKSASEIVSDIGDALKLRDAFLRDLDSGKVVPAEGLSAAVWGTTWLRDFRSANRGFKVERGRFHLHIATAGWAKMPLRAVEPPDIILWLQQLQKARVVQNGKTLPRTLGFQTRKHARNLASAMFTDAVAMGICKANPLLGIKVKKTSGDTSSSASPRSGR